MATNPKVVVSFIDYELPPRYDGKQWTELVIEEGDNEAGPFVQIDSQSIDPTINPAHPEPISFTTEVATLQPGLGWYKVTFIDSDGDTQETMPRFNAGPIEILCTVDDINSHFDNDVLWADANNSQYVQVSVARLVKGYLARIVDPVALANWASPEVTPDIIREIAAMLCASQIYIAYAMRTSIILDTNNFAQRLYDEAMALLGQVIAGVIPIIDPGTDKPIDTNNPYEMEDGLV